jgi:CheY-like chemotaxis protein
MIVRKAISGVLKDLGHSVFLAENANQALSLVCQTTFDVLITDFRMPGKNGLELIREMREKEQCPPKVILMSANTQSNLPTRVAFLKKPFSFFDLEIILEETG